MGYQPGSGGYYGPGTPPKPGVQPQPATYYPQATPPPTPGTATWNRTPGGQRPDWSGVTPTAPVGGQAPTPTPDPAPAAAPPAQPPATQPDPRFDMTNPGDYEDFYSQHGNDLMSPSASEQLYAEGMAGSNPYYDYAEQQATNSVNAAERARGGYNSGAALAEIGNASANLRGQQAHELGQLAEQADTSKLGRYGLTGQMADTSQNHRENRIETGFTNELALDTAQANPVAGFYSTAGSENQQSQMAAIEAWGKAHGMSAAEIKQFTDLALGVGDLGVKAAAA